MKQLTCEMCGSTDLIKQDGVFVCQGCGCKYSVEEARALMTGETTSGSAAPGSPVRSKNTEQINNYLMLAKSALDAENGESCLQYADKALEIDSRNADAWLLKMKSYEYTSTYGNLQINETIEAGKNAIMFSDEKNVKTVKQDVYSTFLVRAYNYLMISYNKYSDVNSIYDLTNTYTSYIYSSPNLMAAQMNTINYDNNDLKLYRSIENQAVAFVLAVPLEAFIGSNRAVKVVNDFINIYKSCEQKISNRMSIYKWSMPAEERNARASNINKLRKLLNDGQQLAEQAKKEAQIKIEKDKKEANERYWAEHADEKKELDAKKNTLTQQIKELKSQISEIEKTNKPELDKLYAERDEAVPAEAEYDDILNQINNVKAQMDSLGLFKMKERKELKQKINEMNTYAYKVKEEIEPQKRERKRVVNEKINKLKEQGSEQRTKLAELNSQHEEVEKELNKDRRSYYGMES